VVTRPDNPGVWCPPPLWYALDFANRRNSIDHDRWGVLRHRMGRTRGSQHRSISPLESGHRPYSRRGRARFVRAVQLHTKPLECESGVPHGCVWAVPENVVAAHSARSNARIVQQVVILPEERYLTRRFGRDYEAYARRVCRWL